MKEILKTTKKKEKEDLFIKVEIFMKEKDPILYSMALENTPHI
eukprot:CAMPEP_0205814428 /NCGR_PEP_ID=MMETSP0205-20121125/19566_1 /ASSEMBLY_ACC=CAM_ASM_000278 /TAXON_ID=36767 /ORGANISM="Euplotes focardii, Strain TN1" /LENGTH=42 /DNA_ID= /DNA_START= /DNA_END= /DNA_ORIENTATION=